MTVLVLRGHPTTEPIARLVITDRARERQAALASIGGLHTEDLRRTDVVRGGGQIDDESRRKQIWPLVACFAPFVDKDVREGSGSVANVGGVAEGVEDLPHAAVYPRRFMLDIGG